MRAIHGSSVRYITRGIMEHVVNVDDDEESTEKPQIDPSFWYNTYDDSDPPDLREVRRPILEPVLVSLVGVT